MENKYFGFICMIILASFLIKSALALTPYKIEVEELPIKSVYDGHLSVWGDFIAYKSGINEISLFNIKTKENKVVAKFGDRLSAPEIHGNYIIYTVSYRNEYAELMKYSTISNKNYIIMPFEGGSGHVIADNKLVAFPQCGLYPDRESCEQRMIWDKNDVGSVIIDLIFDSDYPPSQGAEKCVITRQDAKNVINGIFKKYYTPINPKEPINCKQCNIFTGETNFTDAKDCEEPKQKYCSIGTIAFNPYWEIEFHEGNKICYNKNMNYTLYHSLKSGVSYKGVFENSMVISSQNGTILLAKVKFGDLQKICKNFSFKKSDENFYIDNQCDASKNNICECEYSINSKKIDFNSSEIYTFSLINLNNEIITSSFNTAAQILNDRLSGYFNKLKAIGESEQKKKLEEENKIKNKAKNKRNLILFIIFLLISPFMYYHYKKYTLKQKIKREKREKIEEERKRVQEGKHKKEIEEFRKSQLTKGLIEYNGKWGTPEEVKSWKEIKYGLDRDFLDMGHFEFEKFIAKLFEKMGYHVELTPKTGDYGIDIIAKDDKGKIAIQVKQYKNGNNIGNETIQNLLGAMWRMKAYKAIIITTSDFTRQARIQAEDSPIELWNLQTLKNMVRKYFIESDKTEQ